HDHNAVNDHITGLGTVCDMYNNAQIGGETSEACLDVVEAILAFLRNINHQLTDNEALCFIPTIIHK
ncbi:hypothetical protein MPER_14111, partial [Moniliophthora perniciosa FA553]